MEMDSDDVAALNVHNIINKDHLQDNNKAKYTGMMKFNPKSFKSYMCECGVYQHTGVIL